MTRDEIGRQVHILMCEQVWSCIWEPLAGQTGELVQKLGLLGLIQEQVDNRIRGLVIGLVFEQTEGQIAFQVRGGAINGQD